MPTTAQMQTMMDHWEKLVPSPAFDMAYKWSSQNGDTSLGNTPGNASLFPGPQHQHRNRDDHPTPERIPPRPQPPMSYTAPAELIHFTQPVPTR